MEINIHDYLNEEELKDIAAQEFKNLIKDTFKKEKDVTRIISNASYETIYRSVDDLMHVDSKKMLAKEIKDKIEDFSAFSLFNKPDAWSRETNHAYDFVQQCIKDNYQNIRDVVEKEIGQETLQVIQGTIPEVVRDVVAELLREEHK